MPYLSCPTCALTTYTAAKFATWDECPRCCSPLGRQTPDVVRLDRSERARPAQLAANAPAELWSITARARC